MYFTHNKKVIENYPNNYTGLIKVVGFNDSKILIDYTNNLKNEINDIINSEEMKKSCIDWQNTFAKMGAKPNYKSSLTAAYDFYKKHNYLYTINTIVDFYNHYSLANMVPMGAYDIVNITGNLELTIAKKDMEFIGIGGKDIQKTKENEVIYKDDARVTCRYWNLKDCDATKITETTTDILFMFDIIKQNDSLAINTFSKIKSDFEKLFVNKIKSFCLTGKDIADSGVL